MGKVIEFKAKGMTFRPGVYPDRILDLRDEMVQRQMAAVRELEEPDPIVVTLLRDPENEHDPNAVAVHIPWIGRDSQAGWVPKELAVDLAPTMDRGDTWVAEVEMILIDADHPDKPGILVRAERTHRVPSQPPPTS